MKIPALRSSMASQQGGEAHDVGHRQGDHRLQAPGEQRVDRGDAGEGPDQGPVAELDPLRLPGGARRVEEGGDGAGVDGDGLDERLGPVDRRRRP
jgi:hypothetical protein